MSVSSFIDHNNFCVILTADDSDALASILTLIARKKGRRKATHDPARLTLLLTRAEYIRRQVELGLLPFQVVQQLAPHVVPDDFHRESEDRLWQPCYLHGTLAAQAVEQGLVKLVERHRTVTETYERVISEPCYEPQGLLALPYYGDGGVDER